MEVNRAEIRERLWPFFKNKDELEAAVDMMLVKIAADRVPRRHTPPNRFSAKREPKPLVKPVNRDAGSWHSEMIVEGSRRLGEAMEKYTRRFGPPPQIRVASRPPARWVKLDAATGPCFRCGAARGCNH